MQKIRIWQNHLNIKNKTMTPEKFSEFKWNFINEHTIKSKFKSNVLDSIHDFSLKENNNEEIIIEFKTYNVPPIKLFDALLNVLEIRIVYNMYSTIEGFWMIGGNADYRTDRNLIPPFVKIAILHEERIKSDSNKIKFDYGKEIIYNKGKFYLNGVDILSIDINTIFDNETINGIDLYQRNINFIDKAYALKNEEYRMLQKKLVENKQSFKSYQKTNNNSESTKWFGVVILALVILFILISTTLLLIKLLNIGG